MDIITLNNLWEAAKAEDDANKEKVISYIKEVNSLVNKDVEIQVLPNLDLRADKRVSIEFLKPNGKVAFGADINFEVCRPYSFTTREYGEPQFSMGCSTMGTVTREEAPYQVCRCYLMAELWKREQDILDLFASLTYDADRAAYKAQQEYDREQKEIEDAEEEKLMNKIKSELVPGYKFSESSQSRRNFVNVDFEVEKITAKRCYLKYIVHQSNTKYFYDEELKKRTKINYGIEHITYTGYIKTEILEGILFRQAKHLDGWYVAPKVDGIKYISDEFEIQRTEDIPEEDQW